MLRKLAEWLFKGQLRSMLKAALTMLALSVDEADVEKAKKEISDAVIKQRGVPGELRKYAAWRIDQVTAQNVTQLITKLERLFAVLVLAASIPAMAAETMAFSVTPERIPVGATGTIVIALTNTSEPVPVLQTVVSSVELNYTDVDAVRTVITDCSVVIERPGEGGSWTNLNLLPYVPEPLVADWGSVSFGGAALNPRVALSATGGTKVLADALPAGATWTTTFKVSNPK